MADGALSDLTVLELSRGIAVAFCGKALADLGADVIKAEPLEGDRSRRQGPFVDDVPHPERSGQFLYLNNNKRGITLNLESEGGRRIVRDFAGTVDIILCDLPPRELEEKEFDYDHLRTRNGHLIMTSITPFGLVGPYRDYRGTDFTSVLMSGVGRDTPYNEVTDLESQPPLVSGGFQADYLSGVTAATATMIAVFHRSTYGEGQLVDISAVESMTNMIRPAYGQLSYNPDEPPRPREKVGFPWVLPCKDGYISLSPFGFDHWWEDFKPIMGNPEWAESELFDTREGRTDNADALEMLVLEWTMQHTREEIYRWCLERQLPSFPVHSMADLVDSPQYSARDFFVEVEHPVAGTIKQPGAPARYSGGVWEIRRPAPQLGEHNQEILCGLLGYTGEELLALARSRVI